MRIESTNRAYLYTFNFNFHFNEICRLESRQLFGKEFENKILFSDIEIDPSISAFIKNRIELISSHADYDQLLTNIKEKDIHIDGFNIEYVILPGDTNGFVARRQIAKDLGYCIEGDPDFKNPAHTYAICNDGQAWHFGTLTKHDFKWQAHKQKPHSFSNSIDMVVGKSLVSIATKGNKAAQTLDACCGVGTVMLEACFSKIEIAGCDIHPSACQHAKDNLAHFNYSAPVFCTDIKDHDKTYDAVIVDLPYNLYSISTDDIAQGIISSAAKLAPRLVIVSIADIRPLIANAGLVVRDSCAAKKSGNSKFERKVWVCAQGG